MLTFNTDRAVRLAMIAAAAASLAACASRPKPSAIAPTTSEPATTAPPATTPPPSTVGQGPIPGSEQDFVVNVGDRVYFDLDSYDVRSDAMAILDGQAAWLARYQGVMVRIEGNADERGTREYNLALGARRANSIRDYLVSRGVSASRIATISYGKERPVDPGADESAYQRNRNGRTALASGAR